MEVRATFAGSIEIECVTSLLDAAEPWFEVCPHPRFTAALFSAGKLREYRRRACDGHLEGAGGRYRANPVKLTQHLVMSSLCQFFFSDQVRLVSSLRQRKLNSQFLSVAQFNRERVLRGNQASILPIAPPRYTYGKSRP